MNYRDSHLENPVPARRANQNPFANTHKAILVLSDAVHGVQRFAKGSCLDLPPLQRKEFESLDRVFSREEGWGEGVDKSTLRHYAKDLRKNTTDTEQRLWYYLRAKRLGFKFKRQVPIGTYIVDFI